MKIHELQKMEGCGCFPTPLHKLERLSRELGCEILVKRDDLTGVGYSGNKIRKLQYLVQDAKAQGCTAMLTFGGVQTNHGRQMAAVANKYGMKSIIIATVDENGPPEKLSGNLLLDAILGTDVRFMDTSCLKNRGLNADEIKAETVKLRRKAADQVIAEYAAMGEKVYEMPSGGSTPLGCMGYFFAVEELQKQLSDMGRKADYLICPCGSNGTFAGLWLGAKYFKAPFEVIGACVSPHGAVYKDNMAAYINETSRLFELGVEAGAEDLNLLLTECAGTAYDAPDPATFKTIYRLAASEGMFVDPCYTGKGFTAVYQLIEKGIIPKGSTVVFLHTGGLPALFSEQHLQVFSRERWEGQVHPVIRF